MIYHISQAYHIDHVYKQKPSRATTPSDPRCCGRYRGLRRSHRRGRRDGVMGMVGDQGLVGIGCN